MRIKKALLYTFIGLIVCTGGAAAIFGPALILRYYDSAMLNIVTLEEKDTFQAYKYSLSADDKLYVLSNALKNRTLPQSEYFAAIRGGSSLNDVRIQSYAFQPVYKESEFNQETQANAFNAMLKELSILSEKGVIPLLDFDLANGDYDTTLYTAIDVLEPKKSVSVWQIKTNDIITQNGLVDCVMDAQTDRIYSISLREDTPWEQYDPDVAAWTWADRLGASRPEPYESDSALTEDATYYKKYSINGMEGEKTIVTIGYYEWINEFFIKIT